MNRKVGDGAACNLRRNRNRQQRQRRENWRQQATAQPGGKGALTALGFMMIRRLAVPFEWQHRFNRTLAGAEGDKDTMGTLSRHEARRDRDADRQRAERQQGKKPATSP
nr:hypothetical protein [Sphingobium sp.]